MEFLTFFQPTRTLALKKGPIPKPAEDEVLIKVAYAGVCGTDLHILAGNFPVKDTEPVTLGHEFAGIIEAVGSKVKIFKVGQKVSVDPNSGCNLCDYCHGGTYQLCSTGGCNSTIGLFKDGGFATHCVVPQTLVFAIPDDIHLMQAALAEPLSCLAHGWDIASPVHVGQRVLIIGAGIIGLLWTCILHLHGLRKTVTVSEPNEKRREIVKNLGLGYEAKRPEELKGREFDLIVDCSGFGPAIEAAMGLLASGGKLCMFGISHKDTKVAIEPYQMYKKEATIRAININPFTFPKSIALINAMHDTYLNYEKLGIGVFKLSQYNEAFDALRKGQISKAVFKL